MIKAKVVEFDKSRTEELQQIFLDTFLWSGKFTTACNRVGGQLDSKYDVAPSLVGSWVVEDEAFRAEFEKVKKIVQFVSAEKVEQFMVEMGMGAQQTGKDAGIGTPNTQAGHTYLSAVDPARWSSKTQKETKKQGVIPRIEYHDHPGRPKKDG